MPGISTNNTLLCTSLRHVANLSVIVYEREPEAIRLRRRPAVIVWYTGFSFARAISDATFDSIRFNRNYSIFYAFCITTLPLVIHGKVQKSIDNMFWMENVSTWTTGRAKFSRLFFSRHFQLIFTLIRCTTRRKLYRSIYVWVARKYANDVRSKITILINLQSINFQEMPFFIELKRKRKNTTRHTDFIIT